jgi:hypothetical protein
MRIEELSPDQLAKVKRYLYDRIVEKHEGPWDWAGTIRSGEVEFLAVAGYTVLLPVERTHHSNITILRCIPSADGEVLTVFLQDTTYFSGIDAGFLAVCERVPGECWFIATVYHEWFIIDATGDKAGSYL